MWTKQKHAVEDVPKHLTIKYNVEFDRKFYMSLIDPTWTHCYSHFSKIFGYPNIWLSQYPVILIIVDNWHSIVF